MKQFLTITTVMLCSIIATAQKGVNYLGFGAELGLPVGGFGGSADEGGFKAGFGGYVKGLFGVSKSGQVTVTTGYSSFTAKGSSTTEKASINIIPIFMGYRHSFNGFYLEPQAGIGIYGVKVTFGGESFSSSENKFTWAIGGGYAKNSIDLGIRYQSGLLKDSEDINLVAIRFGYNFELGKSKK